MRTLLIAVIFTLAATLAQAQTPAATLSNEECLGCHDAVDAKKFDGSIHAPLDCTSCHSDIQSFPHEPAPAKVDCGSCHAESVAAWDNSLHAKSVKSGTARGAKCADCCPGTHDIRPSSDPRWAVNPGDLQNTCGKCHEGAQANFTRGRIHLDGKVLEHHFEAEHPLAHQKATDNENGEIES